MRNIFKSSAMTADYSSAQIFVPAYKQAMEIRSATVQVQTGQISGRIEPHRPRQARQGKPAVLMVGMARCAVRFSVSLPDDLQNQLYSDAMMTWSALKKS